MRRVRGRTMPLVGLVALALGVGACTEQLDTGATCPVLCPGQSLDIVDTVLTDIVALDTTLVGFPFLGTESALLLASRGDTLDARVVIRFDTLTRVWSPVGDTARPITVVDSLALGLTLRRTAVALPDTLFIDAYDVTDTTAVDSLPGQLTPFFSAANRLGTVAVDSATFRDSLAVRVPLDPARFLAILGDTARVLRIGLRVRGRASVAIHVRPTEGGLGGPSLRYRPATDSGVAVRTVLPYSRTPRTPAGQNAEYADYGYVASGPVLAPTARLLVGGVPGRRSYLRFALPRWLTDSVAVLSAKLELVQDPVRGLDARRAVTVRGQLVLAGTALTDLGRASRLLAPGGTAITDSLVAVVGDSGVLRLEMNGAIRQWRTVDGVAPYPPALVLRPDVDGVDSPVARFFAADAPAAVRPRLRVSFVPAIRYGRP